MESGINHTIEDRRSTRKFKPIKLPPEDLGKCIQAARLAPSACNTQPWKFILIDDPRLKDTIAKDIFSGIYSMNSFASSAAALIVIVSERQKALTAAAGMFRKTDFRLIDIGIACAHIVLQAEELKIGTCILGWFDEKKLKKYLHIPWHNRAELIIALGYPAETERNERRLKDIKEVFSKNIY